MSQQMVHLDMPDHVWLKQEAERRGCTQAQVVRDSFRAYRKLEPEAVKFDPQQGLKYKPVSF